MCVFMMVGSVQKLVHQQPPAGGTSRLVCHTGSSREASLLPSYPQLFTAVATTRTSDSLARNTTLSLSAGLRGRRDDPQALGPPDHPSVY